MIDMVLFYAFTGAAAWAAETKRWGWCVALCLLAIAKAIKVWA